MMKKMQKAFTLIELLLVVVLLVIISASVIMTLRQHAITTRVNKVAYETEQILQAAITFYTINNKWPTANISEDCKIKSDNPFIQYLPNKMSQSSLGSYFCWNKTGKKDQLFWVALAIPEKNNQMATRIAAQLPNAIITSNPNLDQTGCLSNQPCYVRAEISGAQSATNSGQIVQASGYCETGNSIKNDNSICADAKIAEQQRYNISFPACAADHHPKIILSPNNMKLPYNSVGYIIVSESAKQVSCTNEADSNGQQSCQADITVSVCDADGTTNKCPVKNIKSFPETSAGASYTVICAVNQTEKGINHASL